jgi:hypothetical protein
MPLKITCPFVEQITCVPLVQRASTLLRLPLPYKSTSAIDRSNPGRISCSVALLNSAQSAPQVKVTPACFLDEEDAAGSTSGKKSQRLLSSPSTWKLYRSLRTTNIVLSLLCRNDKWGKAKIRTTDFQIKLFRTTVGTYNCQLMPKFRRNRIIFHILRAKSIVTFQLFYTHNSLTTPP